MPTFLESAAKPIPTTTESPVEIKDAEKLPLSFAQQRLWFFNQLAPNNALYNIPTALRLFGSLNVAALEKSLNTIVARHESLRTNFISDSGTPSQVIRPQAELKITFFDLSDSPFERRDEKIKALLQTESEKPFDLTHELLIRVALIRINADEHILFFNLHHIISDEWSMRILLRELAELYKNLCDGSSPDLAELPIQYADYALWQRECLTSEVVDKQVRYWKNQLADFSPLNLPIDHQRKSVQSYNGASRSLDLSKGITEALRELSRKNGVTLFITLLTAFKALLHRYTGQEQITVGSPISGRDKIETENLIGFFVNTLVLRTPISGDLTFRELLERVRGVTLGAFAHQELPFERLIEELQPERNAGQTSFIQTMFSLQNASAPLQLAGLKTEFLEVESNTAKFDLTFVVRDKPSGLSLLVEYNTDLFEGATIERMLGHYAQLLEAVVENSGAKLARLNVLPKDEVQQLLVEWNHTESQFPREKCVHELFRAQAAKTPDATAVIFGERQLTYRELDERSNQLANHLRKLGVGPDVLVGICVERSPEMVIGFLGILKAGGAYVPLDVDYPPERLAFMIEDAQSPVLLTQTKLASRFSGAKAKVICLDADWPVIAKEEKFAPESTTNSEHLAYVIYTSGSTGKPKGVAVPHRAISRLVFNTNYIQLDSSDRIAQASNSSFDAATFEIWGALLHGGTLIGFSKEIILSPTDFAAQLEKQKISALFLTTALFNQIASDAPRAFGSVKNVLFGGEAVDPKSVGKILATAPPKRLLHVYGPTECTTFASWYEIKNVAGDATTIPIGKPLSNTQFLVLDRNLQLVPLGVPGELHLGGDGLARGYLNRPELNAEKFIPNPFAPESLLYKTGDLVRYLPDGNIEFIGRIDHQVKIRGFRIELPEIETVLRQGPGIKDALVLVRGENADKQLIGYLVVEKNSAPNVSELRQILKQKLPDYMVPSVFIPLENFPLNPNGKVDRRALPAPESITHSAESRATPLTTLETQLKEVWESVIGRSPIDVRDNFFDLGGHSLLAVRLFAQIEKVLGKKLPLALLFQSPTIELLANAIEAGNAPKSDSCLINIQPNGFRPPMFWLHTLGGGGGGGVLRYQKLSQLLGPEQPSYGLVAPPEPFTRIEAMAAHYIKTMRTIQPVGPYHLGGYCFGGVVAFEMAQQLQSAGEEVAILALLDSSPPNVFVEQNHSRKALNGFAVLPKKLQRFFRQDRKQIQASLRRKAKKFRGKLQACLDGSVTATANGVALEDVIDMANYPADYKRYAEVHWNALNHYQPKFFTGKITLIETTLSPMSGSPGAVWKTLARDIEIKRILATHETMLEEPHVQMVAAELSECLARCRNHEASVCAA